MTDAELNEAVALEVMGWGRDKNFPDLWRHGARRMNPDKPWNPATDIVDAMEVVEKMRKNTSIFGRFVVALTLSLGGDPSDHDDAFAGVWWIMMNIAPRAICEAALQAVRATQESERLSPRAPQ